MLALTRIMIGRIFIQLLQPQGAPPSKLHEFATVMVMKAGL